MIDKSYSLVLVILSVVVATISAYVAIEIAQRVRTAESRRRILWTYGGALALGLGIWSMHFVGMLALHLPVPVWYDALLTFASAGAAVAGCARPKRSCWIGSVGSGPGPCIACPPMPAIASTLR